MRRIDKIDLFAAQMLAKVEAAEVLTVLEYRRGLAEAVMRPDLEREKEVIRKGK